MYGGNKFCFILPVLFFIYIERRFVDVQRNDCQRCIFLQERKRQPGNAWDSIAEKLNQIFTTVSNQIREESENAGNCFYENSSPRIERRRQLVQWHRCLHSAG